MEPIQSKEARNRIRRWTFRVIPVNQAGNDMAVISIPGFTIGIRAAAKQAGEYVLKTFKDEEVKKPAADRSTFRVELVPHERVDAELFAKFLELQKLSDDGKKQSEMYRALVMVACQELSDRHPIELGKPAAVFPLLLKKFHALSDGKDPNAKIELVTTEKAAQLGIR